MDGLLLVDKPQGPTSHDAVLWVRRALPRGVKVGHTGTLDPMATGLLVLVVGRATRLAAHYQRLPKVYEGAVRLGLETDSGDLAGRVLRELPVPALEEAAVAAAMRAHVGRLSLPPPAYSAVKFKGKPLYAYARKGIEVPLAPRPCEVYDWRLLAWRSPDAEFRLECSHGTYARSLAALLGARLGCAAVLAGLRRVRIGAFDVADAMPLAQARGAAAAAISARLVPALPV